MRQYVGSSEWEARYAEHEADEAVITGALKGASPEAVRKVLFCLV